MKIHSYGALVSLALLAACADPPVEPIGDDRPTGAGDVVDADDEGSAAAEELEARRTRLLPATLAWLQRVNQQYAELSVDDLATLESVRISGDYETAELDLLAHLPALREVIIWRDGEHRAPPHPRPAPTDEDLAALVLIPRLRTLRIGGWSAPFTDAGLRSLSAHEGLGGLWLAQAQAITDEGLRHVATMPALLTLNIHYTKITDVGLAHLLESSSLESVDFGWAADSKAALRRFVAAHPEQTLIAD